MNYILSILNILLSERNPVGKEILHEGRPVFQILHTKCNVKQKISFICRTGMILKSLGSRFTFFMRGINFACIRIHGLNGTS